MTIKPPLENLRLSERERESLLQIKRLTGIENWNVLCRLALCISFREGPIPVTEKEVASDSSLEMSWRTLVGEAEPGFLALLHRREPESSSTRLLRSHLARGIALVHARLQTDSGSRRADPLRLAALIDS